MAIGNCTKCGKEKYIHSYGKSKGICHVCYKKYLWKPKLKICRRCKRERAMHAKSLCQGCYHSVFHIDKVRANNIKKYYNIDYQLYKKLATKCIICGFDKILHLID